MGQASVNPPNFCSNWGTSTLQTAMPRKLKTPPSSKFQVTAKLKPPRFKHKSKGGGGSRWPDPAVH